MTAADRILGFLRKAGPLPAREISAWTRLSKETVRDALHMLEGVGKVASDGPGGKGHPAVWRCTDFGAVSGRNEGEKSPQKPPSCLTGSRELTPPTPPTKIGAKSEGVWRPSGVTGAGGAQMWLDPDGFLVSQKNMTPELKLRLGIIKPETRKDLQ